MCGVAAVLVRQLAQRAAGVQGCQHHLYGDLLLHHLMQDTSCQLSWLRLAGLLLQTFIILAPVMAGWPAQQQMSGRGERLKCLLHASNLAVALLHTTAVGVAVESSSSSSPAVRTVPLDAGPIRYNQHLLWESAVAAGKAAMMVASQALAAAASAKTGALSVQHLQESKEQFMVHSVQDLTGLVAVTYTPDVQQLAVMLLAVAVAVKHLQQSGKSQHAALPPMLLLQHEQLHVRLSVPAAHAGVVRHVPIWQDVLGGSYPAMQAFLREHDLDLDRVLHWPSHLLRSLLLTATTGALLQHRQPQDSDPGLAVSSGNAAGPSWSVRRSWMQAMQLLVEAALLGSPRDVLALHNCLSSLYILQHRAAQTDSPVLGPCVVQLADSGPGNGMQSATTDCAACTGQPMFCSKAPSFLVFECWQPDEAAALLQPVLHQLAAVVLQLARSGSGGSSSEGGSSSSSPATKPASNAGGAAPFPSDGTTFAGLQPSQQTHMMLCWTSLVASLAGTGGLWLCRQSV